MVTKLIQYMKARAKFENQEWELTENDLTTIFDQGCRSFFGVVVDENGNLLEDQQQPSFFRSQRWNSIN